jgi:hypothetical protein
MKRERHSLIYQAKNERLSLVYAETSLSGIESAVCYFAELPNLNRDPCCVKRQ